jgi:multisubunit Na+/H+ antiporter MnhE subunit
MKALWGIWLAWWLALIAVYLLLVDTLRFDEWVVGVCAAAIAATVGTAVHSRGYIHFWPRAAWLARLPALGVEVVRDCGLLAVALWRRAILRQRVVGGTTRVPFEHGGDNSRDGARRALINFTISLTPNSYVVDIDPESDSLLIHRLVQ